MRTHAVGVAIALAAAGFVTSGCPLEDFEVASETGGAAGGSAGISLETDLGADGAVSTDSDLDEGDKRVSLIVPDEVTVVAGQTILVWAAYLVGFDAKAYDTKDNDYVMDVLPVEPANATGIYVASAFVEQPLEPGDVITVEFVTTAAYTIRLIGAAAFSGLSASDRFDGKAAGAGSQPTVVTGELTTKHARALLIHGVSAGGSPDLPQGTITREDVFPYTPHDYEPLASVTGQATGNVSLHRAFRIVSNQGTYTASGVLEQDSDWTAVLVAYGGAL